MKRWCAELWSKPMPTQSRRGTQNNITSGLCTSVPWCSLNLSVIDFLCLFASLSASLLCCLSASLQTGFLSKPQHTSHRENIIKVAILYFSILWCEKASFFFLCLHIDILQLLFLFVCVLKFTIPVDLTPDCSKLAWCAGNASGYHK